LPDWHLASLSSPRRTADPHIDRFRQIFPILPDVVTEDDVRRIALSLPETTEKPWFGTPGFRVKDKGFLRIRSEAEGGLVVFVSDLGEKEALLSSDPGKFFTTPHYDNWPIVLVNLPAIDLDELEELITESWRLRAPKRLLKEFDAAHPPAR
jgi:hypothetical protein